MLLGPILQCIYYLLIKNFLTVQELIMFKEYHYSILFFNLLPVYPLDGGKLLNIGINYLFSFKRSFKYTFIISYICAFIFIAYFYINKASQSLSLLLVVGLLFTKINSEFKKRKYYFNKFLLERFLHNYSFKKVKVINNIEEVHRDYRHVIYNKGKSSSEKNEISKYFNR